MALTHANGFDGSFTFGSYVGQIKSWSGSVEMVISDTSGFLADFATYRGGLFRGSGSAIGVPSYGTANVAPLAVNSSRRTAGTLTLQTASGTNWSGSALCSNITLTADKAGDATIAFDFVFTGTITETWAAS